MSEVRIIVYDEDLSKQVAIINSNGRQIVVAHASTKDGNTTRYTHHANGHAHLQLSLTEDSEEDEYTRWELEGPRKDDFRGFVFANWFTVPKNLNEFEAREDYQESSFEDTRIIKLDMGKLNSRTTFAIYLLGPSYGEEELPFIIDTIGFEPKYAYHHIGDTYPQVGIVYWRGIPTANEQLPEYDESQFRRVS